MKKEINNERGQLYWRRSGGERFPKVGASLLVLSTNFKRYLVLLGLARSPSGFILRGPTFPLSACLDSSYAGHKNRRWWTVS